MSKRTFRLQSLSPAGPNDRASSRLPSLVTPGGDCNLKEVPKYTGTEMIGISIIHKSCLQPIFSQQAAVDVANMRR